MREGSEEYLDSEKYETKKRALDGPLLPLVAALNRARRENPALQHLDNITFLETENEQLFAYLKRTGDNTVIVCRQPRPVRDAGRRLRCSRRRPAFAPTYQSVTCSAASE